MESWLGIIQLLHPPGLCTIAPILEMRALRPEVLSDLSEAAQQQRPVVPGFNLTPKPRTLLLLHRTVHMPVFPQLSDGSISETIR